MTNKPISEVIERLRVQINVHEPTNTFNANKTDVVRLIDRIAALEQQLASERAHNVTNAIRAFVTDGDIKALNRFAECCDDPESGGHDLEKEQVTRLEKIGALQRHGRISYITDFGDLVLSLRLPVEGE